MNKLNFIRSSGVFCFIWFSLVLSGCYTTSKNIVETSEINQVGEDSSIVFGRIQWLENGEEKKIGKAGALFEMSLWPVLIKTDDDTTIRGEINEGGYFVWALEAGTYRIHRIEYWDTWWGLHHVVMNVTCRVPENGKVYYAGILRCEFEKKRNFIGDLSGRVKFTIQDEADRDFVEFQDKFSIPSKDIKKSLMTVR